MTDEDGGRRCRALPCVPHLATGVEEVVTEAAVGLKQVGLDPSWWLNGHLGAILQDGHWELVAGQAGEPQAEVPVNLVAELYVSVESHTWWVTSLTPGCPLPSSTLSLTSLLGGPGQVAGTTD